MQSLVDVQIQGVDHPIPVEVCIDIVVGISLARTVRQFVQIQVQRIGITIVVQITIAQIAVAIVICIALIGIGYQRAVIAGINDTITIGIDPDHRLTLTA